MQKLCKIGLFLNLLLILSAMNTHGAPSKNESNAYYDDDYDDIDDYYEANETDAKDFKLEDRLNLNATTTTTTTTTRSPFFSRIFDFPKRSNHIIDPVCPENCSCMEDFKYIKCSYANLTRVPPDMPNTAHIIDLSHNKIQGIEAKDFANLTKVLEIKLNNNQIAHIEKDSFSGMKHLKRLLLADNKLNTIHPDTFGAAKELSTLDLSNNSIVLPTEGPFLNQPGLVELICNNCSWTTIYDDTFANMSSLTNLKLDGNDFQKKINTKAFTPLRELVKLKVSDLDKETIQELCSLLKSIDTINFKHFNVYCLELVLGYSFNDSLTVPTEKPKPKPKPAKVEEETPTATAAEPKEINKSAKPNPKPNPNPNPNANATTAFNQKDLMIGKMNISEVLQGLELLNKSNVNILSAGMAIANDNDRTKNVSLADGEEASYQVPVSEETINIMLISIMILAVVGLLVGLICRKDVGGIKTKCCRTKHNNAKDPEQEQTPEEIPLNKLGN